MFVKQRRTHSWSSYLPGKKYIHPQGKIVRSLHHYVLSQWKRFWVYIYALCIGLRSQMLYPNRRIEIWQLRMFVKQRRTHSWSSYLPGKNMLISQQISSNLYIIMFEVSENVSDYAFMHTAATRVHKCFTREGHLKSAKNECLWSSVENTGEAVTCSLHELNYEKILLCTLYHEKHAKFNFAWNFVCTKKQGKILLARGLSIQQLSALGCRNVTLLLLLLRKKCEYHRTCCDYLVANACQDGSAWNERKKLQHFHQLVLNMFWDLW